MLHVKNLSLGVSHWAHKFFTACVLLFLSLFVWYWQLCSRPLEYACSMHVASGRGVLFCFAGRGVTYSMLFCLRCFQDRMQTSLLSVQVLWKALIPFSIQFGSSGCIIKKSAKHRSSWFSSTVLISRQLFNKNTTGKISPFYYCQDARTGPTNCFESSTSSCNNGESVEI